MRSIKVIVRASNEMFRQSVVSLDMAIQNRLVTDIAAKLDTQLFSALGDGITTPKGLFAYSGRQTFAVGGALTLAALLDAWGKGADGQRQHDLDEVGPWTARVHQAAQAQGRRRTVHASARSDRGQRLRPVRFAGDHHEPHPRYNGETPTARAAQVDFSQIAVARDLAPSITVRKKRYAEYDEQALRVITRYDAVPVNPQAIVVLNGITI